MLLVIPSVEIRNGKCALKIQGARGFTFSDDPIEVAKLWRKENAKSLHVTDLDGVSAGVPVNFDVICKMVRTVDIPIELGGGLRSFETVRKAIENGIYRAVIGTMLIENPDEARKCIDKFGASEVVLAVDAKNYRATIRGGEDSGLTPLSAALNAKELGFRRIIYTDVVTDDAVRRPNYSAIDTLIKKTQLRCTVSGGISGLDDLLKVQTFESSGVDSVIIGRALYENRFPCQQLWRLCEAGNYPFTARV